MNPELVFDLDGTLITCENKQKYVLLSVLNAFDGITCEKLDSWWGLKRNGYTTEKALIELQFSNAKVIADQWIRNMENFVWGLLDKPFDDSLSTLQLLKITHNAKIIILTGRKSKYQVHQALFSNGFNKYIDDLIVVNPFRAVEEKAGHLRKIKPLVYIGDSEIDYLSATSSGVRFIALTRGQRSKEFLEKAGEMQIEDDLQFLSNKSSLSLLINHQ